MSHLRIWNLLACAIALALICAGPKNNELYAEGVAVSGDAAGAPRGAIGIRIERPATLIPALDEPQIAVLSALTGATPVVHAELPLLEDMQRKISAAMAFPPLVEPRMNQLDGDRGAIGSPSEAREDPTLVGLTAAAENLPSIPAMYEGSALHFGGTANDSGLGINDHDAISGNPLTVHAYRALAASTQRLSESYARTQIETAKPAASVHFEVREMEPAYNASDKLLLTKLFHFKNATVHEVFSIYFASPFQNVLTTGKVLKERWEYGENGKPTDHIYTMQPVRFFPLLVDIHQHLVGYDKDSESYELAVSFEAYSDIPLVSPSISRLLTRFISGHFSVKVGAKNGSQDTDIEEVWTDRPDGLVVEKIPDLPGSGLLRAPMSFAFEILHHVGLNVGGRKIADIINENRRRK